MWEYRTQEKSLLHTIQEIEEGKFFGEREMSEHHRYNVQLVAGEQGAGVVLIEKRDLEQVLTKNEIAKMRMNQSVVFPNDEEIAD